MSTVRLRRLAADYAKLQEYARLHPRVRLVQAEGDPPERYQIEYRIKSVRMVGGELQSVQSHLVEVALPRNYPRTPPQCRMLSPVFHPNIAPHAICVGDHWSAGESLQSIIMRIGEMLAYQSYNVKSPLNGEAARWVEVNKERMPLDPVSMLVDERQNGGQAGTNGSGAVAPQPVSGQPTGNAGADAKRPMQVVCPNCQTTYRVAVEALGRKVRCKNCSVVFDCASPRHSAPQQEKDSPT